MRMKDTGESRGGGYTIDWLTHNLPIWVDLFAEFINPNGTPNLRILEIGSHEGRSALWWLNNLLRDKSSQIVCVDPWDTDPEVEKRFDVNIALSGKSNQVKKLKGLSRNFVPYITDRSLDIAHIDGSHEGRDVILDGLMVLPKMKPGGIILFDDYKWENPDGLRVHLPEPAIDAFLELCDDQVEVIHKGYQVAVKVKR
jgi:hypothetical protein